MSSIDSGGTAIAPAPGTTVPAPVPPEPSAGGTATAVSDDLLGKDGTLFDPERAQRTIEALRLENREAKRLAKERDELAAKLKEHEDAQKSDLEKAQSRIAELEAQQSDLELAQQESRIRLAVLTEAGRAGIAEPELALGVLDRSLLEFDASGAPTNAELVLAGLVERYPLLKASPGAGRRPAPGLDGGDGAVRPPGVQPTAEQLEAAKMQGMDIDRYMAIAALHTPGMRPAVADLAGALNPKP